MTPLRPDLLAILACSLLPAADLLAQERTINKAKTPHGEVQVRYATATLRGRGLKDLKPGQVWRMSAGEAAELITAAPLLNGKVILPPGSYRLSARYLGKQEFRLLLFQGPRLYQEGTPYQEVPLAMGDLKKPQENLAIKLWHSEDDSLRGKLAWGTHSLNFNLQVLPLQEYKLSVGGKPGRLQVFGLPKTETLQETLKAGSRLLFGALRQDGPGGLSYRAFAVNKRRSGFEVLFRNATLDDTRVAVEAARGRLERVKKMLDGADEERKARIESFLKRQSDHLATLRKTLTVAESHPRKVVITCPVGRGDGSNRVVAKPTSKPTKALPTTLDIAISFGLRTARLRLDGNKFAASKED